jgi:hypothetical protein
MTALGEGLVGTDCARGSMCIAACTFVALTALPYSVPRTIAGKKKLPVVKLVDSFDAAFSYEANDGSRFVFTTNLDAPRYRFGRALPDSLQQHTNASLMAKSRCGLQAAIAAITTGMPNTPLVVTCFHFGW